MDAQRFDGFAKRLALGLSRRRLIGGLAAVTVAGAVPRPAATAPSRSAPRLGNCIPGCCNILDDGKGPCCTDCEDLWPKLPYAAPTLALAGIAGAGTIRTEGGAAHFTLFASRLTDLPDLPPDSVVPFGRVQWRDPEMELTLESIAVASYGWQENVDGGRWVLGVMRANGAEEYPFILEAVAAEPVGGGHETVSLRVGDAAIEDPRLANGGLQPAGFAYAAAGELVAGDLQLLDVDMSQQVIQQTTPS